MFSTQAYHGACGVAHAPWTLSFGFAEPTTVSTVKLTADAPADYPLHWQLEGSVEPLGDNDESGDDVEEEEDAGGGGGATWHVLLSVRNDAGLNPRPAAAASAAHSDGTFAGTGGIGDGAAAAAAATSAVGGCASHLRQFRCDAPQTRAYEVTSPGDYAAYRLVVRAVHNAHLGAAPC